MSSSPEFSSAISIHEINRGVAAYFSAEIDNPEYVSRIRARFDELSSEERLQFTIMHSQSTLPSYEISDTDLAQSQHAARMTLLLPDILEESRLAESLNILYFQSVAYL